MLKYSELSQTYYLVEIEVGWLAEGAHVMTDRSKSAATLTLLRPLGLSF